MTRSELKRGSIVVAMVVIGLAMLYGCVLPAVALTITGDNGGVMPLYEKRFQAAARKGEKVVVDGPCKSACTLVLSYVPIERICVTPRASFGFHKSRWLYYRTGKITPAPDLTKRVFESYPAPIQQWIEARGGWRKMPNHPHHWYLRGAELDAIIKRCA